MVVALTRRLARRLKNCSSIPSKGRRRFCFQNCPDRLSLLLPTPQTRIQFVTVSFLEFKEDEA